MSINPLGSSGVNNVTDLAQALIKNFDKDKDGRLSADEFTSLLGKLLSGPGSPTSPTSSANAAPAAPEKPEKPAALTSYTLGIGFVPEKLNDPTYFSEKYSRALKQQFLPAMQGLSPVTESLQKIVDRINANGGKATVTGKDTIDFGDDNGPIDVIVDVGGANPQWGFQNTSGNELWAKRNAVVSPMVSPHPAHV